MEQCERPLHTLMAHQLGWVDELGTPTRLAGGERLRAVLCLLAAGAAGGDEGQALPAAASVELAHNFSLIHEDIQSGTQDRDNRPSVWWVWGPAQAINAGDGMHALARLALFRLSERGVPVERVLEALTVLDRSCLQLCEGQHSDLTYQEHLEVPEENYLKMVEGKTGALFGCALELAALVSGADAQAQGAFGQAGRRLGMAYQVHDDILGLWPGEVADAPLAGDILNKKKSLPVIYGMAQAKGSIKRELGGIYFKRVLEPQDATRVAQILEELGAREYAQQMAERLHDEAVEALEGSGLRGEALAELTEVAQFLVERAG